MCVSSCGICYSDYSLLGCLLRIGIPRSLWLGKNVVFGKCQQVQAVPVKSGSITTVFRCFHRSTHMWVHVASSYSSVPKGAAFCISRCVGFLVGWAFHPRNNEPKLWLPQGRQPRRRHAPIHGAFAGHGIHYAGTGARWWHCSGMVVRLQAHNGDWALGGQNWGSQENEFTSFFLSLFLSLFIYCIYFCVYFIYLFIFIFYLFIIYINKRY